MKALIPLLFAYILLLTSCDDKNSPYIDPLPTKIPILISSSLNDLTKVTNNAYENGDKIGLYVVNQLSDGNNGTLANRGNQVDNMDFTLSGARWVPSQIIYWKDEHTKADLYCYQPFSDGLLNVSAHLFTIQTDQSTTQGYKKSDFTWGKTESIAPTQSAVPIQTKHLLSNILIYIKAGNGFTQAQIDNADKKISLNLKPSCSINLASSDLNSAGNVVAITPKNENEFYSVIVPPQTIDQNSVFMKIEMNGQTFEFGKSLSFISGKQHRLTVTLNISGSGSIDVGLSDWDTGDEITLDGGAKRVSKSGGLIEVKVKSSINYRVEIPSYCQSWIKSADTKSITTEVLRFAIQPNTGTDSRQGEILFRDNVGTIVKKVEVQQSSSSATNVHVDIPGTLSYLLEADLLPTIKNLTISGNIISDDFHFIRDAMPELESLDICATSTKMIPDFAFHDSYQADASFTLQKLKTIKLPETVVAIGMSAFSGLKNIETIKIPNVITIHSGAFSYCTSLTSIDFNPNLRSIGGFAQCTSLKSIHIPSGVIVIENSTFSGCSALKTVTFAPQSKLSSIGSFAFGSCAALEAITIPDNVTTIGSSAFWDCAALKTVILTPQSKLTSIGSSAFWGCAALEAITIPDIVTTIGSSAFWDCAALKTVILTPQSKLTSIGTLFNTCPALETITIPDGITTIESNAFKNCIALKTVTLTPQSELTSIGSYAFENCAALEAITIPDGITTIESSAFQRCNALKTVILTPQSELTSIGSYAFENCAALEAITIPDNVTTIGSYAFQRCNALKTVILTPQSKLTSIGTLFNTCPALETITIPDGITTIESNAFKNCIALKTVTLTPQSELTSIGSSAFENCVALEAITIPDGITTIESYAFEDCTALTTVICYATTPPAISSSTFYGTPTTKILKVPAASLSAYKSSSYWNQAFNNGNNIQSL